MSENLLELRNKLNSCLSNAQGELEEISSLLKLDHNHKESDNGYGQSKKKKSNDHPRKVTGYDKNETDYGEDSKKNNSNHGKIHSKRSNEYECRKTMSETIDSNKVRSKESNSSRKKSDRSSKHSGLVKMDYSQDKINSSQIRNRISEHIYEEIPEKPLKIDNEKSLKNIGSCKSVRERSKSLIKGKDYEGNRISTSKHSYGFKKVDDEGNKKTSFDAKSHTNFKREASKISDVDKPKKLSQEKSNMIERKERLTREHEAQQGKDLSNIDLMMNKTQDQNGNKSYETLQKKSITNKGNKSSTNAEEYLNAIENLIQNQYIDSITFLKNLQMDKTQNENGKNLTSQEKLPKKSITDNKLSSNIEHLNTMENLIQNQYDDSTTLLKHLRMDKTQNENGKNLTLQEKLPKKSVTDNKLPSNIEHLNTMENLIQNQYDDFFTLLKQCNSLSDLLIQIAHQNNMDEEKLGKAYNLKQLDQVKDEIIKNNCESLKKLQFRKHILQKILNTTEDQIQRLKKYMNIITNLSDKEEIKRTKSRGREILEDNLELQKETENKVVEAEDMQRRIIKKFRNLEYNQPLNEKICKYITDELDKKIENCMLSVLYFPPHSTSLNDNSFNTPKNLETKPILNFPFMSIRSNHLFPRKTYATEDKLSGLRTDKTNKQSKQANNKLIGPRSSFKSPTDDSENPKDIQCPSGKSQSETAIMDIISISIKSLLNEILSKGYMISWKDFGNYNMGFLQSLLTSDSLDKHEPDIDTDKGQEKRDMFMVHSLSHDNIIVWKKSDTSSVEKVPIKRQDACLNTSMTEDEITAILKQMSIRRRRRSSS